VHDDASLLAFAERALLLLEDHHAITGSSFPDSWGIVPSFADLWIERQDGTYRITAVRENSPAEKAGIKAGSKVTAINKVETAQAVAAFWADLGRVAPIDDRAASFAARILATASVRSPSTRAAMPRTISLCLRFTPCPFPKTR
jgi:carboxyl-terminal processing protease